MRMAKQVNSSKLRFDDNERWLKSDRKVERAEKKVNRARRQAHYHTVLRHESSADFVGTTVNFHTESMEKTRFGKMLQQHGRNMRKFYDLNRSVLNEAAKASGDGIESIGIEALQTVNDTFDALAQRAHNRSVKKEHRLVKRSKKLDRANKKNLAAHIVSREPVIPQYQAAEASAPELRTAEPRRLERHESSPQSKAQQKRRIKKEYAKEKRNGTRRSGISFSSSTTGSRSAGKGTSATSDGKGSKAKFLLLAGGAGVILILLLPILSFGGAAGGSGAIGSMTSQFMTYPASEDDILAAEAFYCQKETDLAASIAALESEYDECIFDLDAIEHDPYVLISMVSAFCGGEEWFLDDATMSLLDRVFARQYTLTQSVSSETRKRTEIRIDPATGKEITVEVEYTYTICTVTLDNANLSHLPVHMMPEEQLSLYALYMSTLGGMDHLFPNSKYIALYITNPPDPYTVDPAYIAADPFFGDLIAEAEKYLGYPYVWGGSNPGTSFDCSGFVSWVLNQCGYSIGRLGAQGLYGICTPIRKDQARPGDLIFFTRTYEASHPVTHVGIYVGHGMMLHCGDPIRYQSVETPYFSSHFYSYGRLPQKGG